MILSHENDSPLVGWIERSDDPTQSESIQRRVGSSLTLDPTYDPERSSVRVVTLGCRLNAFESEVMRAHAAAAGLADTVIVNTCAVTTEAVRQAAQTIRKLKRENPQSRLIVTGCAAQIEPQRFAAMPEVDRVIGNAEKLQSETYSGPSLADGNHVARVGAWRRPHPSLRQRGLCCGRVRGAPQAHRAHRDRDAARRASRHRVAQR